MKRIVILPFLAAALLAPTSALATLDPDAARTEQIAGAAKKSVAWRGTAIVYENIMATRSLDKGLTLDYDPYYAMSLSFRPRYYVRDDLSFRARMDLEVELTQSEDTDYANQWIVSDLNLYVNYSPEWAEIPYTGIKASTDVRLSFPTSPYSQARSMVMGLAPGLSLRRSFDLLSGKWLKAVYLRYSFRATKFFNEYGAATIDTREGCRNTTRPECQHSGLVNTSWRLVNGVGFTLQLHDQLAFGMDFLFMNNFKYQLEAGTYEVNGGVKVDVEESDINMNAAMWSVIDLTYDPVNWLSLSLGLSTFVPTINTTSDGYFNPFYEKYYTNVYLDMTIPVDRFVSQVQDWTGWGKGS